MSWHPIWSFPVGAGLGTTLSSTRTDAWTLRDRTTKGISLSLYFCDKQLSSLWLFPDHYNATCAWSLGFQTLDFPRGVLFPNSEMLSASHYEFLFHEGCDVLLDYHMPLCCLFTSCDCESHAWKQPCSTFCALQRSQFDSIGTSRKICHCACFRSSLPIESRRCVVVSRIFDATRGYSGEGPRQPKFVKFITANLGSLKTNHSWKSYKCDVCCIQETRIGKNNLRSSRFDVQSTNKELFPGKLLPGILQKNGRHRTAHGGTAIISSPTLTRPFDPKEDATGLYEVLFQTHRCNAVWFQVTRTIKVLIFSFYGHTGVHSNAVAFDANNQYLENIFEIANQFGDIPVVVAGDFQAEPLQYPSVAKVASFFGWTDPLDSSHEHELTRPLTYSLDSTFSGPGDKTSSIDGFLLNRVALCALVKCEVIESFDNQHRPVQALFKWEAIVQDGFVHRKTAALDLTNLRFPNSDDKLNTLNDEILNTWSSKFAPDEKTATLEEQWDSINAFCLDVLLQHGASWKSGPRSRGQPPEFTSKKVCPGQIPSGAVKTSKLHFSYKAYHRFTELEYRLQRQVSSPADWHVTRSTIKKARKDAVQLRFPYVWSETSYPTLVDVYHCKTWLWTQICSLEEHLRNKRIANWKEKVKCSADSSFSYVFSHLKNKVLDEPANLVTSTDGSIIYQPQDALTNINEQWDDIFSANALQSDPMKIVEIIWPYIKNDFVDFDLPDLSADALFSVVQNRKAFAAPGLDGWRTTELQALPKACFVPIAAFFKKLELCQEEFPKTLLCAKQMILNKNGRSEPLQKRLITVLPALLLSYTGARYQHLQPWQQTCMPKQIVGGIKHRHMSHIPTDLRLQIDKANVDETALIGIKLDKSKCFDLIVPNYIAALLLSFGMDKKLVNFFIRMYQGLHRHLF